MSAQSDPSRMRTDGCTSGEQHHALHIAVRNFNVQEVKRLLKENSGCYSRNTNARSPLQEAIAYDNIKSSIDSVEIIKLLLAHQERAVGELKSPDGSNPLFAATQAGNRGLVQLFVTDHDANIKCRNWSHEIPLHEAIQTWNLSLRQNGPEWIIQFLVDQDPSSVMCCDRWGRLPLHLVLHKRIAQLLLESESGSLHCYEQLLQQTNPGVGVGVGTSLDSAKRRLRRTQGNDAKHLGDLVDYLESFQTLPLAVSEEGLAVRFNARLTNVQERAASNTLSTLLAVGFCPGIAHGILGYLAPIDVMKRRPQLAKDAVADHHLKTQPSHPDHPVKRTQPAKDAVTEHTMINAKKSTVRKLLGRLVSCLPQKGPRLRPRRVTHVERMRLKAEGCTPSHQQTRL